MRQATFSTEDRVYRDDTLEAYQQGVARAIGFMYDRLGELLTVNDVADSAFMSRFHFSRVFSKITGVSPARFLAAIRMQEAKRLLLKTDRSVTEISLDVGYNSLGTFTRIFADFVGFPPVRFRQLSLPILGLTIEDIVRFLPSCTSPPSSPTITGQIVSDRPLALVAVALFPTAIPRSHPIECMHVTDSLKFSFSRRPLGACIFAAGLTPTATFEDALLHSLEHVSVGTVDVSCEFRNVFDLVLHQQQTLEPPILVAFPLLIVTSMGRRQMSNLGEAGFTRKL